MSKEAIRTKLIENESISKLDRAFAILKELRNGRYYAASNFRAYMVSCYKDLAAALSIDDYNILKSEIVANIPALIAEREDRKVAYSLISDIVCYSCINNFEAYHAYERNVLPFAKANKKKYFLHVITLAQTCGRIFGNIDPIEDFFIDKYLGLSGMNTVNYKYLSDYTTNVSLANKGKLLKHLLKNRPFYNDKYFINKYIMSNSDLGKYAILL